MPRLCWHVLTLCVTSIDYVRLYAQPDMVVMEEPDDDDSCGSVGSGGCKLPPPSLGGYLW